VIGCWFDARVWPWPAKPKGFVDRRLLEDSGSRCRQLAKVVIADGGTASAQALITSANFNENPQRHNFDAGWLMVHHHFVPLHP
jgi:hypothetical protein